MRTAIADFSRIIAILAGASIVWNGTSYTYDVFEWGVRNDWHFMWVRGWGFRFVWHLDCLIAALLLATPFWIAVRKNRSTRNLASRGLVNRLFVVGVLMFIAGLFLESWLVTAYP
jgi:hypothetical protein